jgi:predicted unusual protein kinase regulating ubiquinone biosynthesis (AarF/ABC1/UbiB family)
MTDRTTDPRGLAVPSGRLSRLARLGGMAGGVAGNMAYHGARTAISGQRPDFRGLLLTPGNAKRVADELARMRGAAMKMGQLLSMESGDLLPPELADVLARLRQDADFMPPKQLRGVLDAAWGPGFQSRFANFNVRPIAAASIGQVHRARLPDGTELAIKVQYPGVRRSIDSDVDNVGTLIRMTGLLPQGLDIAPYLAEAKRQLHEEADYRREAEYLQRFGEALAGDTDFNLPVLHDPLTTDTVLAMTYLPGQPVESLIDAAQQDRDRVAALLIRLVLRELFDFGLMQTDPNFANYRYDPETGRIILLDFGAARDINPTTADRLRAILRAGLFGDNARIDSALRDAGFIDDRTAPHHADLLRDMARTALEPLRTGGLFDFADTGFVNRMRRMGQALGEDRSFATIPPMDVLFVQRKVAGMYLLAARLRARVPVADLFAPYL